MSEALHPNLARVAARYDEVLDRWQRGTIDAAEAHTEMAQLAARDDDGILWSISATTGSWQRETHDGRLVEDTPPRWGLSTPTPWDFGDGGNANPDERIKSSAVDTPQGHEASLRGSTRRAEHQRRPRTGREPSPTRRTRLVLAAAVALCVTVAAVSRCDSEPDTGPAPPTWGQPSG